MHCEVHAEYVTAGCDCGARLAAQYVFFWKQIPAALRPGAIKVFGAHGKWRIQPLRALRHARLRQSAPPALRCATASSRHALDDTGTPHRARPSDPSPTSKGKP